MKQYRVFYLGSFLLLINLCIDSLMFLTGLSILGIISLIGTTLVFSSALIWFLYRDEQKLKIKSGYIILPIGFFCAAVVKFLKLGSIGYHGASEDLLGVGNLLMSRYEGALWLISILILLSFVLTGSLLVRRTP